VPAIEKGIADSTKKCDAQKTQTEPPEMKKITERVKSVLVGILKDRGDILGHKRHLAKVDPNKIVASVQNY